MSHVVIRSSSHTQSLAFLSRYRTLRGPGALEMDEVNFNFGRAFHQLGELICVRVCVPSKFDPA